MRRESDGGGRALEYLPIEPSLPDKRKKALPGQRSDVCRGGPVFGLCSSRARFTVRDWKTTKGCRESRANARLRLRPNRPQFRAFRHVRIRADCHAVSKRSKRFARFLIYRASGDNDPDGRFGIPRLPRRRDSALTPRTRRASIASDAHRSRTRRTRPGRPFDAPHATRVVSGPGTRSRSFRVSRRKKKASGS